MGRFEYNGIIVIYKEKGFTSHDVVAKLRGILKQKKIGHTGTLDPMAEGVLPVCLGSATKLCDMLTESGKEYETTLLLGKVTDTQDVTGTVLNEAPDEAVMGLSEDEIRSAVNSFTGDYRQIPPMYSALKVNGKKLYELAREGKTVERKARLVTIYKTDILSIELPLVRLRVSCSKGTYIRTLCEDIGNRLSVGGTMQELLRTRAHEFDIKDSHRLSEIEELNRNGELINVIIPTDSVFKKAGDIHPKDAGCAPEVYKKLLLNGNTIPRRIIKKNIDPYDGEQFRFYDEERRFIGLYSYDGKRNSFVPEKMFL
ncbi:MAG: tRNA pseudouridine(55) synthase TruB [Lachnospiraceae bacterium]|nr:tRNA pseudouridine(55) synthase TruB [Lachnospiraceae bacterium]